MLDKERFCTNKLWHLNFLAPTFWNWRQNLTSGDFSGARAAPAYIFVPFEVIMYCSTNVPQITQYIQVI